MMPMMPYPISPMSVPDVDWLTGKPIENEQVSSVKFISIKPEDHTKTENNAVTDAIKEAAKAAASEPVKVRVRSPFRVVHEGKPFVGGDVVEVPNATAQTWIKAEWAEPVPPKGKS
jgi:hypothetical protein